MDPAYLFNTGQSYEAYHYLGSHRCEMNGQWGWMFRVWAPNAAKVSLCGNFNAWNPDSNPMNKLGDTGIWELFYSDLPQWERYKYFVLGADGKGVFKADPFAIHQENRPGTSSILYDEPDFTWDDAGFMEGRKSARDIQPLNIYEVHLGSWRQYPDGNFYNYRDIASQLASYCKNMGYNAVELLPITEYPLDDSWGYQVTGYFAPTSRYGTPDDFKYFVNRLHKEGIRVILDWVPAHFPKDAFGLYRFDGSPCYEYTDSRLAEQKAWGTMVFDFGKSEVRSFLYSSAFYWLKEFHIDGLRVDAVSSMIYLDYGRTEFIRNKFGGNDNLEALEFMRKLNSLIEEHFPKCFMIAEESTAYPYITKPASEGGLGFTHKWNMGWMHDTLNYFSVDYYARKFLHNNMTFSMTYAFSERYILPYSHDEVVHGKLSIIGRQPGDIWRQCASLRTCYAWQIGHPGGKLNFMGNEFGQFVEWRFREELEWFMLEYDHHRSIQDFNRRLNRFYLNEPAMWQEDQSWDGFHWVQADDKENSVFAFVRQGGGRKVLCVYNMTPAVIPGYEFHVSDFGQYKVIINSDDKAWGGSSYWGENTEGRIFTTELKTLKAWKAEQKKKDDELRRRLEKIDEMRKEFLEMRDRLFAAYKELLGDQLQSPDDICDLHKLVERTPKIEDRTPQTKLVMDLPPLAAVFFEYLGEQRP